MLVRAAHPEHFEWLRQHTGCLVTPDFRALEAVDGAGHVRGMVGFAAWTENSVYAHMAVETPIAWRKLLRSALAYAFVEAGRGLILGIINASNARSLAFAKRIGFREAHRVKDGVRVGVDQVLLELRREECSHIQDLLKRRAA